jgi:hypothetical protein
MNILGWLSALTIDKGLVMKSISCRTIWWQIHSSHKKVVATWLDNKLATIFSMAKFHVDASNNLFLGGWHGNQLKIFLALLH